MQDLMKDLKHQVYEIFPTVIYRGEIKCHENFKEKYLNDICEYWHFAEDLPRDELESPENSGRYFLHHNQNYQDFFNSLVDNVRQYLRVLSVDESMLNVYVTKSWLNIHKDDLPDIKIHSHNCSDISFCYYLNCNETSDKLCFYQSENNNEVSDFMFQTTKSGKYNLITNYNKYNCNQYTVTPIEGTVVLFPSHIMHSTMKMVERVGKRISVCGDITLTLRDDIIKCEYSRVDPSLWRKF